MVLTKSANSGGSNSWDLSGLWHISDIIPSWYGEFSSKSLFISKSKSKFIFLHLALLDLGVWVVVFSKDLGNLGSLFQLLLVY